MSPLDPRGPRPWGEVVAVPPAGEQEQWLKNREYRERLENRPRRQNMAHPREEFRQERCHRPGQAERPERPQWAPAWPPEEVPLTKSKPHLICTNSTQL